MKQDERTDLFLSLTPDRIFEAVEAAGLRTNPVCYALNSYENRVYEIELEDQTRVIAKFYRPGRWTKAQLQEEHDFMAELAAAEIPVCPTLPFPDRSTLHEIDGIAYTLFARRAGRAPEEVNDTLSQRLGMLTARIHNVGASRPAQHRLTLSPEVWIGDNLAWLLEHDQIAPHLVTRYCEAAEEIARVAAERFRGVPMHRIHGDMHLGNLLLRDGAFNVLDFDDMVIGPAVQDVWMMIPGRDDWSLRQMAFFMEGYEQLRSFPHESLRLIEPLRGMRMVHYTTWLARRWHDPVFPRTWPHFKDRDYWDTETRDLEEICELLAREDGHEAAFAGAGVALGDKEDTSALTNADYFFDWED